MMPHHKQRILVTGASGFVGYNLASFFAERYQVFASYHDNMTFIPGCTTLHIDITDLAEVASIVKAINPVFIINAAAIASPDACAQDPQLARLVNVDGVKHLLAVARIQGCRLVHLSTDMVFEAKKRNYSEDDAPRPINLYGKTKRAGERLCFRSSADAVVVRITLQYGWGNGKSKSFAEWLIDKARRTQEVPLFTDQFRTPTYVADTVAGLELAALHAEPGSLYHLAGPDRVDRYTFGMAAATAFGLDVRLLKRACIPDVAAAARRPRDISLNARRFSKRFNFKPQGIHDGLAAMARGQKSTP